MKNITSTFVFCFHCRQIAEELLLLNIGALTPQEVYESGIL